MEYKTMSEWLEIELRNRGWSQSELARRAGVTRAAINGILTGGKKPGNELCEAIARAFRIPPEDVFRIAGLLPPKPEKDSLTNEAEFLLSQLPEHRRRQAVEFIRYLAEKEGDDSHAAAAPMEDSREP